MTNRWRQTNHEVMKEKVDEFEMMKNMDVDDEGKIFGKHASVMTEK